MKVMKKACMILMALSMLLPVAALADESALSADVEMAIVGGISIEETESLCHVAFYDYDGIEIASQDVAEGSCATAPELEGFTTWYDITSEEQEAFDFATPVYDAINLFPQTQTEDTAEQILGQSILATEPVIVEEQPEAAAMSILGDIAATEAQNDTADILTIDQVFAPQTTETSDTASESILSVGNSAAQNDAAMGILAAAQNDIVTIEENEVPLAAPALAPSVEVICDYEGSLTPGTEVTVRAVVHNLPEGYSVAYQWQNDANGSFADVAGANGQSFTFTVGDFGNEGCNWRVNVDLFN